jgi:hypothetical protein
MLYCPAGPKKRSSRRRLPGPRISAGREGTALILGGGPSLRLRHVSHETSEAAQSRRLPGNEIDAEFCRRWTVPRKLLLRIQKLNRLPGTGPRRTTLAILAGPRNEGTKAGPAKVAVRRCPSITKRQALRTQPEKRTIALVEAPAWVTPLARKGAQAAEDGTLEPLDQSQAGRSCVAFLTQHKLRKDIRCHSHVITLSKDV